jgi:hypothetical protein
MEVQRPSLPSRIGSSAKSLGAATFSGISGLDSSFRDLRASKQWPATSESYDRADHNTSAVRLSKRKSDPAESSFRAHQTVKESTKAQSQFDDFRDGDPVLATPEYNKSLSKGGIDFNLFSEGSCAFSEGWMTPRLRPTPVTDLETEENDRSTVLGVLRQTKTLRDTSTQSTAIRRLEQVDDHLQHAISNEAARAMLPRPDLQQPGILSRPPVQRQSRGPVMGQKSFRQEHPLVHDESTYHCPHSTCQYKMAELQRLRQVSCMPRPRSCVHNGCAFRTATQGDWMEHVQKPHHKSQTLSRSQGGQ